MKRYEFIENNKEIFPVLIMCRVLKVSRSSYYSWINRTETNRELRNKKLIFLIKTIWKDSRKIYGYKRITAQLNQMGYHCSKHLVYRLMKELGIRSKVKKKFKITTLSKHKHSVAPNILNRNFEVDKSNEVWLADITYIHTSEGWLYLSLVMDLYNRKIVGWALENHMKKELVLNSLESALARYLPGDGLLHHSDRGVQYACNEYIGMLSENNIECSMSRKGNCWDNAPMESLIHTIKTELIHHEKLNSRYDTYRKLFDYIEIFYNNERLHSSLGYTTPNNYGKTKKLYK